MTYSELQTLIQNMLGARTDLASEVPTFITMAEGDFNLLVRCREMESRVMATATEYLSLPDDYLELRDVQLNVGDERRTLQMLSPSELDRRYSTPAGEPKAYALIADQIQLAPSPDSTYEVEIVYYQQIPTLTNVNTTNWLLTKFPNMYLYQSLFYAMTRAQYPDLAVQWGQAAKMMMDTLNGAERRQRWSGPPLEIRPA